MNKAISFVSETRTCTRVWLLMIGLTLAVLAVGQAGLGGIWVVALLLLSTLLKTQLVADYFMALKYSRPLWRIIITVYLVIIVSMIGLAYWLGASDIS